MFYHSTRGGGGKITAAEAIATGLSSDGGLYLPESLPWVSLNEIERLASEPYSGRAAAILGLFLDDFTSEELNDYTREAYSAPGFDQAQIAPGFDQAQIAPGFDQAQIAPGFDQAQIASGFDHPQIAPLHRLDSSTHFLELWHGPTSAFKDMALQMLPRLMIASLRKTNETRDVCILVATSGDTGKAALEGFCDVAGTKIMVFYPRDGVSDVQKLQMITQKGANVNVVAVEGNFDDAQTGVKSIFSDEAFNAELDVRGCFLSSANSINWGRLVPQIAYYVSAYCDLLTSGAIKLGESINFCVPTGNFGNILAGYYAMKIGLPIKKLICASNKNDVLADFIETGVYDKNRPFYTTASPSMDILVSSNLERLLFELSGKDGGAIAAYMSDLSKTGRYAVPSDVRDAITGMFASGRCSEAETASTIDGVFREHGYLIDTHTAVAYKALRDYRADTGDGSPTVVVSTASPFKFSDSVLSALGYELSGNGMDSVNRLADETGCGVPAPLRDLHMRAPRFTDSVPKDEMKNAVQRFIDVSNR
ncbi:MAG: threonine synthase [Oscillospiraceae bacterium]|nr:threonine synthase [Oscillospiraceae bacterium]